MTVVVKKVVRIDPKINPVLFSSLVFIVRCKRV